MGLQKKLFANWYTRRVFQEKNSLMDIIIPANKPEEQHKV
jgi:hypothetical protein